MKKKALKPVLITSLIWGCILVCGFSYCTFQFKSYEKTLLEKAQSDCQLQMDQTFLVCESSIDELANKYEFRIEQTVAEYESAIDEAERACESRIEQTVAEYKSRIEQRNRDLRYYLAKDEAKINAKKKLKARDDALVVIAPSINPFQKNLATS